MTSRNRMAREWAEKIKSVPVINYGLEANAAADHIMATTDPLTMADVEWDDHEHYLTGATSSIGGKECVMISEAEGVIVNARLGDDRVVLTTRGALTPNGKKYELREVGAGEPDVHRARALVEELARDHNLHSLSDGKLARSMNAVLDALTGEKPEHPQVLSTVEDYQNAPVGTVVAAKGFFPYMKLGQGYWVNRSLGPHFEADMASEACEVLRWGWGE